jgi:hypothetical protein
VSPRQERSGDSCISFPSTLSYPLSCPRVLLFDPVWNTTLYCVPKCVFECYTYLLASPASPHSASRSNRSHLSSAVTCRTLLSFFLHSVSESRRSTDEPTCVTPPFHLFTVMPPFGFVYFKQTWVFQPKTNPIRCRGAWRNLPKMSCCFLPFLVFTLYFCRQP